VHKPSSAINVPDVKLHQPVIPNSYILVRNRKKGDSDHCFSM